MWGATGRGEGKSNSVSGFEDGSLSLKGLSSS